MLISKWWPLFQSNLSYSVMGYLKNLPVRCVSSGKYRLYLLLWFCDSVCVCHGAHILFRVELHFNMTCLHISPLICPLRILLEWRLTLFWGLKVNFSCISKGVGNAEGFFYRPFGPAAVCRHWMASSWMSLPSRIFGKCSRCVRDNYHSKIFFYI